MKILLAVDGSAYTKKMLAYLCVHDELMGGGRNQCTLLTVMSALPPRARAALSKEMVDSYYQEESAKVLDPALKFLEQHHIAATTRLEIGPPGEVIARVAEEDKYELIVMGTHGRAGFDRLLFGSVAHEVVRAAPCPVMTVRPLMPKK